MPLVAPQSNPAASVTIHASATSTSTVALVSWLLSSNSRNNVCSCGTGDSSGWLLLAQLQRLRVLHLARFSTFFFNRFQLASAVLNSGWSLQWNRQSFNNATVAQRSCIPTPAATQRIASTQPTSASVAQPAATTLMAISTVNVRSECQRLWQQCWRRTNVRCGNCQVRGRGSRRRRDAANR